ncbi:MAG TPA: ribosome maturation factor RimP [Pseudonocardiaceae bacterium]|nr:ribosome maturation factor RimP [Pseudonocardiaceae bacterium]
MVAQPTNSGSAVEPVVRDAVVGTGFELEGLEEVRAGQRWLVRVVIDSDAGVGLDDIATVSRVVSQALDDCDDLLAGPFTLEVTSPGVDRPLTQPRHWRRNRLRLVRVTAVDGAELVGRIGDCDDEGVMLLVSGALRRMRYVELRRAVVEVEFRQPPAAELVALNGAQRQDLEER